jgi:hypothetical protein
LYRDVVRERNAHGVEAAGRYANDTAAGAVRSTLANEAASTSVPDFDPDARERLAGPLVDIRDNAGVLRGERGWQPENQCEGKDEAHEHDDSHPVPMTSDVPAWSGSQSV